MTRLTVRQQAEVLAAAAGGDETAFRRIIAENHEDMRRVCLAMFGDVAIADEAVHAAWLVAWKKLGKVHGAEQLRPWLVSVAVREAKHLIRTRRRHAQIETGVDASAQPGGVDPASGVATVDLHAAVARLDPDDAALVAMRYVAGFDSTELAAATGKTPAAVRQRLKRLLDRLREDLRGE